MRRSKLFGLALGLLTLVATLSCRPDSGPPTDVPEGGIDWTVSAEVDKTRIQVGEALELALTVRHPPGAEFHVATGENLLPFELVERIDDPGEPGDSPRSSRIRLRMAAYRLPGAIAIPPIEVEYPTGPSGPSREAELGRIATEPIPVSLVTSLTPDVTDIHDIKGPISDLPVPRSWDRLLWLLALLALALAAYLLHRKLARRREEPAEAAPLAPLPPAGEEAERALRELAERRLLERGRLSEFYTALTEILKRYGGRRFEVAYLERTTGEILRDLEDAGLPAEERRRLEAILDAADLVKFARVAPPHEDSERMLPEAFRFVGNTRVEPNPATSPEGAPSTEAAQIRAVVAR